MEVIDFSVADDSDCSILVGNRLVACLKVNNAETSYAQSNAWRHVETVAVRSTMAHNICHLTQHFPVDWSLRMRINYTTNSAHCCRPISFLKGYISIYSSFGS